VDACTLSPKRVPRVITVGSSDSNDRRAVESNWGNCVHVFAPGIGITSAWKGSDTDSRVLSGTSMASPLVAGVAALYLQQDPYAPVWKIRDAVLNSSTPGKITDPRGSPNRLAYALPTYFGVEIAGADAISTSGSYTWEALPEGGSGGYSYQWSTISQATGSEQVLGTGRTQTIYVSRGAGDFTLRVVVFSGGQMRSANRLIFNSAGCAGYFCDSEGGGVGMF
jgi:subtilisin family serine protease